jgi:uncharacterized protein
VVVSVGLIALLDEVSVLAKAAAASLDDLASQTVAAGLKSGGIIIDDTAVTPTYVVGASPSRELPMIGRIALGSLKSKLLYLLPIAVCLSAIAPWAITPLLMIGGAYLCFEGTEKIWQVLSRPTTDAPNAIETLNRESEDARVHSAIRTDFILSAEIMAVTLGSVAHQPIAEQATVLAVVGLAITGLVYGVVALIVKADDAGLWLAKRPGRLRQVIGRGLLAAMPKILNALSYIGTAAMIWVGGGVVLHGLAELGVHHPAAWIEGASGATSRLFPPAAGILSWATGATLSGVFGLLLGGALVPLVEFGAMKYLKHRATRCH